MKALLVGLGQIGLGLIAPVFKKAGYEVVGTDVNQERLEALRNMYFIKTPDNTECLKINVMGMDKVLDAFAPDLVVASVGRQNLLAVERWISQNNLSAPVLLAENLHGPVNYFPRQIPIVVDRICPRVESHDGVLTVIAEDYKRIVVLDDSLTRQLGTVPGVELEYLASSVEAIRKQKLFTVNTAHVITALYGHAFGFRFVHQAASEPEIFAKVIMALAEIGPWLGLDEDEIAVRSRDIINRLGSRINDPLQRIVRRENRKSALYYIEVPLNGLRSIGLQAPTLETAAFLLGQ